MELDTFREGFEQVGLAIDAAGVLVVVAGIVVAVGRLLFGLLQPLVPTGSFAKILGGAFCWASNFWWRRTSFVPWQ